MRFVSDFRSFFSLYNKSAVLDNKWTKCPYKIIVVINKVKSLIIV